MYPFAGPIKQKIAEKTTKKRFSYGSFNRLLYSKHQTKQKYLLFWWVCLTSFCKMPKISFFHRCSEKFSEKGAKRCFTKQILVAEIKWPKLKWNKKNVLCLSRFCPTGWYLTFINTFWHHKWYIGVTKLNQSDIGTSTSVLCIIEQKHKNIKNKCTWWSVVFFQFFTVQN